MEQWEIDFNWLKVQHFIKDRFNKQALPKLDTVLFMIGLQELGKIKRDFSKKEKLEITTLGICQVLSLSGYYKNAGIDKEGWPIWIEIKPFNPSSDFERKNELKSLIIKYFEEGYDLAEYEEKI